MDSREGAAPDLCRAAPQPVHAKLHFPCQTWAKRGKKDTRKTQHERAYWTLIGPCFDCQCKSPFDSKLFRIYGGDDGARTRDLCRDRSRKLLKLNNFMSADG
jgi:hypothetical protein